MKSIVLPAILLASAMAARADDLTLVPHDRLDSASLGTFPAAMGAVEIQAGLPAPVLVVPEMVDTTNGRWQGAAITTPIAFRESDGTISGAATLLWGSGVPVEFQMSATPSGRRMDLTGSWKVDGDAAGHFRFDIRIPSALAGEVSVRAGEKELFAGGEVRPGLGNSPLVVTRTSDGTELFRVEGDFFAGAFVEAGRFDALGLMLRVSPHKINGPTTLGEFSEFKLELVCP